MFQMFQNTPLIKVTLKIVLQSVNKTTYAISAICPAGTLGFYYVPPGVWTLNHLWWPSEHIAEITSLINSYFRPSEQIENNRDLKFGTHTSMSIAKNSFFPVKSNLRADSLKKHLVTWIVLLSLI